MNTPYVFSMHGKTSQMVYIMLLKWDKKQVGKAFAERIFIMAAISAIELA